MAKTRTPLARLASLGLWGLCAGSLGLLALLVLTGRLAAMPAEAAAFAVALPLGIAAASGYSALRLSSVGVVRVAFEIGGLIGALLLAEVTLRIVAPAAPSNQHARQADAAKLGLPFDIRTKSEVVDELRSQGIDAFPGMSREWVQRPSARQQLPEGLFPLGDAANAEIVECNESGKYVQFPSDEYGFHNPRGLVASGKVDVAVVGDSFAIGHCVPSGQGFVARLRERYPRLANFGMAGTYGIALLATFREYVEPLKPPLVLYVIQPWVTDTRAEMEDPVLRRYLEPGFSQHLMQRREEVDAVVRGVIMQVQYESDAAQHHAVDAAARNRFAGIVTLSELRRRLHLAELMEKAPPPTDLGPFDRSIDLARRTTESWGGRFVVIIMPLYDEVVTHNIEGSVRHDQLAARLRARGMEVIDTVPVFLKARDPSSLYVMRRPNHPGPEGHRMLADFVGSQLQADEHSAVLAHEGARK
jgi:hypothetical protein